MESNQIHTKFHTAGGGHKVKVVMVDQSYDDTDKVPRWVAKAIRDAGMSFSFRRSASQEELRRNASRADIVWVMGGGKVCSADNLDVLERCFAIVRTGTGTDNVDVERATELGIVVANTPGGMANEVADQAVALLLSVVRLTAMYDRLIRAGIWERRLAMHRWHLRGQTAGLVGFGQIARLVADRLRGFNVSLIACDPYVEDQVFEQNGVRRAGLEELLRESDFVSLHCPITKDTFRLIGAGQLKLMKEDAILINTSRGAVVDERALVDALEKGWIGGAGLDVYEHEPLEPESRLRRLDNVVMTPHAAALSDTFEEMGWRLSIESIIDLANGYWPMAVVNRGVKPRRGLRMKPGQESCPRPGSL